MSIDAADAAIDAAVDTLPAADVEYADTASAPSNSADAEAVNGEIASPKDTPCNPDEARALIRKAITAANDFQSAVGELLARRAHIALGYDTPSRMIVHEFSGNLINPRTNKPITDNYLHRMARVAMLLWHVADVTGYQIGDLSLSEHALRQVSQASGGVNDVDLNDEIRARLQQFDTPPTVAQVDEVVLGTIHDFAARGKNPPEPEPATASADVDDDAGGDQPVGGDSPGGAGGGPQPAATPTTTDDTDDLDDVQADGPSITLESTPADVAADGQSAEPSVPTPSVSGAFDIALPDDFAAQISDLDMTSALQHVRTAADVRRVLRDIGRIYELLPKIVDVKKQVPHIVDAIEDAELDALRAELDTTSEAVDWAEQARAVIAEALSEVQIRYDETI